MNIDVTTNKVKVDTSYLVNKNEYNVTTCNFTFSEEYTGLVKQAIFEAGKIAKQVDIINGECDIPYEILTSGYDRVLLRVYAYELNQSDELVLRYSPSPDNFFLNEGSYVLNTDVEPITPTQYEIYTAKLELGLQQAQNVDIDATQTSEGATITITNRNAERKMVEVLNGQDGAKGDTGETGPAGADGKDATINGRNTINIIAGENITIEQENDTLTINSIGGGTGDYGDLENKPSINGVTLSGNKTTSDLGIVIPDVTGLGDNIAVSINSSTYVMTMQLKHGTTVLSTGTVDLPLESMVVNGSYDSTNKKIVLTLQNGNTIDVPVGDLISGLQSEITSSNKLSADLIDDTSTTNKLTNATEKSSWNAKYDKPSGGIPSTDLSSAVQTSLGKADTALQSETYTGTITSVKMNGNTIASSGEADLGTVITDISGKQDILQFSTMPTASADNLGKIIQYIGADTGNYTQGHFYIGIIVGGDEISYQWEEIGVQDVSGKENISNKVTSISSNSTDTQYPSAKCVYDIIGNINTILATLATPSVNNGGN